MHSEAQTALSPERTSPSSAPAVPWDRVSFAPPSGWVAAEPYDPAIRGRDTDHLTHLLWARQVNVGSGETFHSTAVRLETSLAVQHESQWRVQFDPRRQSLTLHWLRVVRGDTRVDHLHRERMRLIQRETQLEHHILDGDWTLIVVLDDVRPGDVIEAAYTYGGTHPICPGATEQFYVVPPDRVVGRHRLTALVPARSASELRWLAAKDAPELSRENLDSETERWTWAGQQLSPREPEPNQPASAMDYTWIQLTTVPSWNQLSIAAADAWDRLSAPDAEALGRSFPRPEHVDAAAVVSLIRSLQDDYRYLSIELEQGGWIPAPPQKVAERRYGDCKDLAWLSASILRSWGVAARPILVGSGLRDHIEALLPAALAFNHAILEVTLGGQARWFDLTQRDQGGSFANQPVTWFGIGLTVDRESPGLVKQPGTPVGGAYEITETFLLETRPKEQSLVEVRLRTTGAQADELRRVRTTHGVENFIKFRLEQAQTRYANARRVGSLHWRDDRDRNECELVEVFSFSEALYQHSNSRRRAVFEIPRCIVSQTFALPSETPRRADWTMPYPLDIRHEQVVRSPALIAGRGRVRQWRQPSFIASVKDTLSGGSWSKITTLSVTASRVAAKDVAAFRSELQHLLRDCDWRIIVPWGHRRPHGSRGFGELPVQRTPGHPAPTATPWPAPSENASPGSSPVAESETEPSSATSELAASIATGSASPFSDAAPFKEHGGPRRRVRKRRRPLGERIPIWAWAVVVLLAALLAFKLYLKAKSAY